LVLVVRGELLERGVQQALIQFLLALLLLAVVAAGRILAITPSQQVYLGVRAGAVHR